MSVQHFLPIDHVDVGIFHRIHEIFDLLVVLEEKSGASSSGHH